ncbi:MAG: hypothetical protein JWN33_71 [Candidatus Saccharibacteria bacterium]|nr:hypothetical protein [Candidatus Saccharibacteria bacterium]
MTQNTTPVDPRDDEIRSYQEELSTDESAVDEVTHAQTDDPTQDLGVSPRKFKEELDNYAFDDSGHGENEKADDDMLETLEDLDDQGNDDGDARGN